MLKFGDVFSNLMTVGVLAGFGYIIYLKIRGDKPDFKNMFSKINIKGGKDWK